MKARPFFSIIIPTYNRAYIIKQAIESVLRQNFNDWEMIIVNDGSTDNTSEVVKPYLTNSRISYYKFDKNKGVNIARNFAIAKAKGAYILPLDSDNQLLEGSLQLIFNILNKTNKDLAFFRIETTSGKHIYAPIEGLISYKDYLCERVKGEYFPIVKRDVILKFRFEESINGGESITWKKIVRHLGNVYFYPYKVLLYNDLLEDRLSIKRRNFQRLSKVFKKDLEVFGKEYLRYCPKVFVEKFIKYILYSIIHMK